LCVIQESRAIAGEPRDAAVNFATYRSLQRHGIAQFSLQYDRPSWR